MCVLISRRILWVTSALSSSRWFKNAGDRNSAEARRFRRDIRIKIQVTLFVALATLAFPAKIFTQETPAANWSQFRGNPRLTGVSDSKVPNDLKLLWTYEAGDSIESSAAIVGSTVFVGSQKGELVSLNL